jgi:hypothetical protein
MSSRKTRGHKPGCRGFTRRGLVLCVQCSIWMFGVALWLVSVTPSTSQAQGTSDLVLAYVVSPPPATREVMPRYLPQLPPERAARIPQVATRSASRLRTGCRCGHLRPRHARRCTHCRHRSEHLRALRRCRHAGHCATHRRGRSEQRRRHPPHLHRKAVNGINGQGGDRVAIAAALGVAVPSARLEDGTAHWASVNDQRSLWARFEAAYNPGCKASRYGSIRCSKKVDISINAWPLRVFPTAI